MLLLLLITTGIASPAPLPPSPSLADGSVGADSSGSTLGGEMKAASSIREAAPAGEAGPSPAPNDEA